MVHHLMVHHLMVHHLMVHHVTVRYIMVYYLRHFLTLCSVNFMVHLWPVRRLQEGEDAEEWARVLQAAGAALLAAPRGDTQQLLAEALRAGAPPAVGPRSWPRGGEEERGRACCIIYSI